MPFLYLLDTTHYDPDDGEKKPDAGVFKVDSVVVEHYYMDGDEVVVYRCKYNELTRTWNPVNRKDPIRVADVVEYTKNPRHIKKMNDNLNMTSTKNGYVRVCVLYVVVLLIICMFYHMCVVCRANNFLYCVHKI